MRRGRRAWMTGTQAKMVGGALAVLACWAYAAWYKRDWAPSPEAGGALSILLIALVDLAFAGGEPTEAAEAHDAALAKAASLVATAPEGVTREALARTIVAAPLTRPFPNE